MEWDDPDKALDSVVGLYMPSVNPVEPSGKQTPQCMEGLHCIEVSVGSVVGRQGGQQEVWPKDRCAGPAKWKLLVASSCPSQQLKLDPEPSRELKPGNGLQVRYLTRTKR